MSESTSRPLRVFLCHSSGDKPSVRELYQKLRAEGWMDLWLDEEKLLPGQDWDYEIDKALDNSDAVIVTLSTGSVSKEGYVQKELRFALNIALEKPEGTIFILPVRLDACERPRRLHAIQGIDYFPPERRELAYARLLRSLELRAAALGIRTETTESMLAPVII
ncbi:MAG TPA: toll/interleukin-1 receptor domain-containing protein, partial [Anaerolineales bacterium]|nr:toll/interleukin-1 receptor domain-containing protein [Anaerolineales bacterium]